MVALPKNYVVKAYKGSEVQDPHILKLNKWFVLENEVLERCF